VLHSITFEISFHLKYLSISWDALLPSLLAIAPAERLLAAAVLAALAESLLAAAAVPAAPARQHAGTSPSPPRLLAMENKVVSMENKLKSMEVNVCDEATFASRQGCPLASRPPVLEEEVLAAAKEKVPGDTIVCHRMDVFAPDSESPELAPDSESLELVADSMENELVEDSLPPGAFVCARCHLIHEDRQAWDRAHSCFLPCSRCGLVHMEYMVLAMFYGFREFVCEVFVPDLNNIVRDGDNIKLDKHVLNKLDEKKAARKVQCS
jgi:hypothetical protein